jgi:hypothetical protein
MLVCMFVCIYVHVHVRTRARFVNAIDMLIHETYNTHLPYRIEFDRSMTEKSVSCPLCTKQIPQSANIEFRTVNLHGPCTSRPRPQLRNMHLFISHTDVSTPRTPTPAQPLMIWFSSASGLDLSLDFIVWNHESEPVVLPAVFVCMCMYEYRFCWLLVSVIASQ